MVSNEALTASQRAPLRLLTITHCFPGRGGGIERVAGRLVEEFLARGVQVRWYSSDTSEPPEHKANRVSTAVPTLNIVEKLTQLPYPIWSPLVIPSLWRDIGRAEVVHLHEHFYTGSFMVMLLAKLRRRPVIVTQHAGSMKMQSRVFTLLYETGARLVGRVMFSAATRVVFISANVCRFYDRIGNKRTHIIFNGLDSSLFPATPAETRAGLRARLGLPADRPVILFVGRLLRKKGLKIIETLTAALPQVLWVFVGSGAEDPARWQRPNVRVVGPLPQEALADFYHASDLLLLPSYGEGFPLVVQEALACGLGVLSTKDVASACPEAAQFIRALPTPSGEPDTPAWEASIRQILGDSLYMCDRTQRSANAHQMWSWDRCASEYLQLFEQVREEA